MPDRKQQDNRAQGATLRRLGENIRSHRRERRLSQAALAQKVQVSIAYVSLIERGIRNPPYRVVAIARAFGVRPSEIVSD